MLNQPRIVMDNQTLYRASTITHQLSYFFLLMGNQIVPYYHAESAEEQSNEYHHQGRRHITHTENVRDAEHLEDLGVGEALS